MEAAAHEPPAPEDHAGAAAHLPHRQTEAAGDEHQPLDNKPTAAALEKTEQTEAAGDERPPLVNKTTAAALDQTEQTEAASDERPPLVNKTTAAPLEQTEQVGGTRAMTMELNSDEAPVAGNETGTTPKNTSKQGCNNVCKPKYVEVKIMEVLQPTNMQGEDVSQVKNKESIAHKRKVEQIYETNNNSSQGTQGADTEESDRDVEGMVDDVTETEDSDNILYEGLKRVFIKRFDRKRKRKDMKLHSIKRSRVESDLNENISTTYSRFSLGYFGKIVQHICRSNRKMELVRNAGFGYTLELADCKVPRPFAQWLADNVNVEDEAIILNMKRIPLNAEAVHLVLGIPCGDVDISLANEECGKICFLSLFGKTEIPLISFFGDKLLKENLSDEDFIRCFMTVALATFLCPTSCTRPSTKYMGALLDVSKLRELNWCKLVHRWLLEYIKKYQTEKAKQKRITTTLGGCIYQLCVRCLDFNDFGSLSLPSALPRICFWKNRTIKHFSDMLIGKDKLFKALRIKDETETCYADKESGWASTAKNSNLRSTIEKIVGNTLSSKVKEEIFLSYSEHMKDENLNTCSKAKQLLIDTLRIISTQINNSQETVKIDSSQNDDTENTAEHESTATVIVDSNGVETTTVKNGKRKRRNANSENSASSNQNDRTAQEEETTKKRKEEVEIVSKHEPQGSTSLNYMLVTANGSRVLENSEPDINSAEKDDKLDGTGFYGFKLNAMRDKSSRVVVEEQENKPSSNDSKTAQGAPSLMKVDIDINLSLFDEIKPMEPTKETIHPLDIASKKYHFLDDGEPNFRLLDSVDDNGKDIEEPDLWRPPGMDSKSYEAQIQRAKKNSRAGKVDPSHEQNGLQGEKIYQEEQSIEATHSYMSVQCAQNDTSRIQGPKYMNTA